MAKVYVTVELDNSQHVQARTNVKHSTHMKPVGGIETFKIVQKGEKAFSGYKKVNFADRKVKEAYRKMNRMLGGY